MRSLLTRILVALGLKKPSKPPGPVVSANPPPTDPPKDPRDPESGG